MVTSHWHRTLTGAPGITVVLYGRSSPLALSLAGNDMFMMMHPTSVQVLKEITQTLYGSIESKAIDISNWIGVEV